MIMMKVTIILLFNNDDGETKMFMNTLHNQYHYNIYH